MQIHPDHATGRESGSGVLIAPDLVLTAGHVLTPAGVPLASTAHLVVVARYAAQLGVVRDAALLDAWTANGVPFADMALLRVGWYVPFEPPVLAVELSAPATPCRLRAGGYVGENVWSASGHVSLFPAQDGYAYFGSSELSPPEGASGGPLLSEAEPDSVRGVLVASPTHASFGLVGLPLLDRTYGELRRKLGLA